MRKIALVMLGGSLGSLCRYGVSLSGISRIVPPFPWPTLTVNLVGCFLIGISFGLAERSRFFGPSARLFFVTGFLGGLTTFSSYSLETVLLAQDRAFYSAVSNILVNNFAGCLSVVAGMLTVSGLFHARRLGADRG